MYITQSWEEVSLTRFAVNLQR
jgi:hypothetical protein